MVIDSNAFFSDYNVFLLVLALQGLGVLVLIIVGWRLRRLIRQYRSLLSGEKEPDLEEIILKLNKENKQLNERLRKVETELEECFEKAGKYLQHWSLSRYKAFANTGGDQSFSLVLLDDNADGFIISSIYGRDESRVYAKTINEGKSKYPLSDEEQEILLNVLKNNKKTNPFHAGF